MRITTLEMTGFKAYTEETRIKFGDVTVITGQNGTGKSTVGEAIAWVLFGTDIFGGKTVPGHVDGSELTSVTVHVVSDKGADFTLERQVFNGKGKTLINGAPVKASEFKDLVDVFFTKEQFLTLFNPVFFASQHWTAQREQFMSYVKEPLKMEVFEAAGNGLHNKLAEELKKMDLDKVEGKHREIVKNSDKKLIELSERIKTYKTAMGNEPVNRDGLMDEMKDIEAKIAEHNSRESEWLEKSTHRAEVESKLNRLLVKLSDQKDKVNVLKESEPLETCISCGQAMPDEVKAKVQQEIDAKLEEAKAIGKKMVAERNALQTELNSIEVPEKPQPISGLYERKMEIRDQLTKAESKDFTKEIEEAKAEWQEQRNLNVKSVEVVDAVKEYRAVRTGLMVAQVNDLFGRLSVKLFNELANGNVETTFEIEFDGKPYRVLSTAERIMAGLELRNAFLQLMAEKGDETAPVFIDNAESISADVETLANGQVMMAVVSQDEQVTFEAKGVAVNG